MKKVFLFILILAAVGAKAQTNPFPTIDSLQRFINRYIRNSPVEAFQNLRLNTSLIGMLRFIEAGGIGSGIDTAYALNDSTLRIVTQEPDTLDIILRGKPLVTSARIAYGDASDRLKDDADLTYTEGTNRLNTGTGNFVDSLLVGSLRTGTASDSVVVWDNITKALKKVLGTSLVTASNGLSKTGNNITLGGLLTGSTFIEGEQNLFAVTNTSQAFIISQNPSIPENYAQIDLSHSSFVTLRNNLNTNQRSDILLFKQKILLAVDYDIISYINSIILDTTFTWANSRFAVYNQKKGDPIINDALLTSDFSVYGDMMLRDTETGSGTDSILVKGSDGKVKVIAQSSISGGGGGGGDGFGIDSTVIGGTTGSLLFVGTGPVLAQDNANLFFDNTNNRLGIGTASPDRLLHAEASDAITNAITFARRISHITSGTATTSFGVGEETELENASGTNILAATQTIAWSDATNPSEDAAWTLNLIRGGSLAQAATISSVGQLTIANSLVASGNATIGAANSYIFSGRSSIHSAVNGDITLFNNAQNGFGRLNFGGTSSSFPSLLRSSAKLEVKLADNSAYTDLTVRDEAYDATTWNNNSDVPTKNAVRDMKEGMNIVQGTYTPTLTNGANADASTVSGSFYYQRIGNHVTVWGMVTVDPNATATSTVLGISLPIASNFTTFNQLSGQSTGSAVAGTYYGGFIQADDTNDRAQLDFTSGSALNAFWTIRFSYEIL
jgi:hypothetical protein